MTFDTFWQAYPRRVGRKAAERKWASMTAADQQFCIASLAQWRQSYQWKQSDGIYIPYASTFLNQERWRDEAWTGAHDEIKLSA
jgi:hypothetical protein